jgi:hypothetical protein
MPSSLTDAIAADPEARRLSEELNQLQARRVQCMQLLNRRIAQIRGGAVTPEPAAEVVDERSPEESDVFRLRFNDCKALCSEERWRLIDECYRIDDDDEMDVIPNLKEEFHSLLSEFELKMGDEFPRMVLMRLVQLYRWMKTFRRRFVQHGSVSTLEEARRIINKFVYKSARLLEDDMVYVLECRMRGIEFKLAQAIARQQTSHANSNACNQANNSVVRPSAFRPITQQPEFINTE